MIKPFSQACENNSFPILNHLKRLLPSGEVSTVLEIGSGSGQHAVYFSEALSHLTWQTSDLPENHEGIHLWLEDAGLFNVLPPLIFDAASGLSEQHTYDAIFMANTFHIMSQEAVEHCFQHIPRYLNDGGLLIVYGPFNYDGQFTSESNERFDQWLKAASVERGIRDFEWLDRKAADQGFVFQEDNAMPSNNRLLVWRFNSS